VTYRPSDENAPFLANIKFVCSTLPDPYRWEKTAFADDELTGAHRDAIVKTFDVINR
jgi:hypothetical protein